jgi:hypothetical protein
LYRVKADNVGRGRLDDACLYRLADESVTEWAPSNEHAHSVLAVEDWVAVLVSLPAVAGNDVGTLSDAVGADLAPPLHRGT